MKKLFAVFLVLLLAAPAIAADWSFYGSARVQTFYTDRFRSTFTYDSDLDLNHSLQGNSRLGANVKADKVSGKVELALRAQDGGGAGPNTGDENVRTRLLWGDWNFADKSFLRVARSFPSWI